MSDFDSVDATTAMLGETKDISTETGVVDGAGPKATAPTGLKTLSGNAPIEPIADPDADKVEKIGEDDRTTRLLNTADEARKAAAELAKPLDDMILAREQLDAKIKEQRDAVTKLETVAVEAVAQISQADMVKKIQAQTGERLVREAHARAKLAETLGQAGMGKMNASPLDAALAAGGKRSTVMVNGKPFQAPHPRSPEGIKSYAQWIHGNGSQRPT